MAGTAPRPIDADYGVRAGYRSSVAIWAVELTGRLAVDNCSDCGFDQRLVNQVAGSVELTRGRVHPQLSVRSFLDPSVRRSIRAILTAGVAFTW